MHPLRFAVFVLVATLPLAAAQPVITPGLWEITITTQSPVESPPMTTTVCLTKDAIRNMDVPKAKAADDCQATGSGTGTTLTYSTRCGKRARATTATYTFLPDAFEGVLTVTESGNNLRQIHRGRRVGNCAQPEEGERP